MLTLSPSSETRNKQRGEKISIGVRTVIFVSRFIYLFLFFFAARTTD